jgi:hypothetical protein
MMSRSDIVTAAMDAGIPYEDADILSCTLSPECGLVRESIVQKAITLYWGK